MPDHVQSPRLGQRVAPENPGIRMFSGGEIPEVSYTGQMIYRTDTQELQVFTDEGAWEDVVGGQLGQLTFVGGSPPASTDQVPLKLGDQWYDTTYTPSKLNYWDGEQWVPVITESDVEISNNLNASSANVSGLTLTGTNNQIASASSLQLLAGAQNPQTPVSLGVSWETHQVNSSERYSASPDQIGASSFLGAEATWMVWDAAKTCWAIFLYQNFKGTRLWRVNRDGTFYKVGGVPLLYDYPGEMSVSCQLEGPNEAQYTRVSLVGRSWRISAVYSGTFIYNTLPSTILNNATNDPVYIGPSTGANRYEIGCFTKDDKFTVYVVQLNNTSGTSATLISTTAAAAGTARAYNIAGVVKRSGYYYVLQSYAQANPQVIPTGAGGAPNVSLSWNIGGTNYGFAHDGTRFWALNSTGQLTRYYEWPTTDTTYSVKIQGRKWDTGEHTKASPAASISVRAKRQLQVNLPSLPVNGIYDLWDVFIQVGGTYYYNTSGGAVGGVGAVTINSAPYTDEVLVDTNTFAVANPAEITTADPDTYLRGDGTTRMGNLIKAGMVVSPTIAEAATNYTKTVTFATPFPLGATVAVTCSVIANNPNSHPRITIEDGSVSRTGFTAVFSRDTASDFEGYWIAVNTTIESTA